MYKSGNLSGSVLNYVKNVTVGTISSSTEFATGQFTGRIDGHPPKVTRESGLQARDTTREAGFVDGARKNQGQL